MNVAPWHHHDVHLAPLGQPPMAYHNSYAMDVAAERFQAALDYCRRAGADMIAMTGDLSHFGDEQSLTQGIDGAAASALPCWMLAGNHDLIVHVDALPRAVAAGKSHVRLAPAAGEVVAGIRVAGVALNGGTETGEGRAAALEVEEWGNECVVVLSHFPLLSLRAPARAAGLKYAGDLDDLAQIAAPLHGRSAPTVVVHGHLHLGHAMAWGNVLQLSCAALIEPPFSVTLVEIEGNGERLTVRYTESSVAPLPDVVLPRLSPPNQTWRFGEGGWQLDGC